MPRSAVLHNPAPRPKSVNYVLGLTVNLVPRWTVFRCWAAVDLFTFRFTYLCAD